MAFVLLHPQRERVQVVFSEKQIEYLLPTETMSDD